jgi:biotin operon repressor
MTDIAMHDVQSLLNRIGYLEEENRQLKEAIMPSDNPFYGCFGLSPQGSVVLNAIYKNDGELSAERLDQLMVVYAKENRGEDIYLSYERGRVAIFKLRKALKPYGIEIQNIPHVGYRMDKKSKAKLAKLMGI